MNIDPVLSLVSNPAAVGILSTVAGAFTQFKAQQHQREMDLRKSTMEMLAGVSSSQDAAAARDSKKTYGAVTRRILALLACLVAFGGLLAALFMGADVSFLSEAPVKSWLWGLWHSGGELTVTTGQGFVIPPYVPSCVMLIVGFYFGSGAVKGAR